MWAQARPESHLNPFPKDYARDKAPTRSAPRHRISPPTNKGVVLKGDYNNSLHIPLSVSVPIPTRAPPFDNQLYNYMLCRLPVYRAPSSAEDVPQPQLKQWGFQSTNECAMPRPSPAHDCMSLLSSRPGLLRMRPD